MKQTQTGKNEERAISESAPSASHNLTSPPPISAGAGIDPALVITAGNEGSSQSTSPASAKQHEDELTNTSTDNKASTGEQASKSAAPTVVSPPSSPSETAASHTISETKGTHEAKVVDKGEGADDKQCMHPPDREFETKNCYQYQCLAHHLFM